MATRDQKRDSDLHQFSSTTTCLQNKQFTDARFSIITEQLMRASNKANYKNDYLFQYYLNSFPLYIAMSEFWEGSVMDPGSGGILCPRHTRAN